MLEYVSLTFVVLIIYLVASMWGMFVGKLIYDQWFSEPRSWKY